MSPIPRPAAVPTGKLSSVAEIDLFDWKVHAPHLASRHPAPTEAELEEARRRVESGNRVPDDGAGWWMVLTYRRRQRERLDFLIEEGYLVGEALEYALRGGVRC